MFVLNYGHIDLEEVMGGDEAVIEAARICWRTKADKGVRDEHLLAKLLALGHGTPFEHAVLRWRVSCPIFVARQWLRHRIGSFNERSLRYTTAERAYYVPGGMDGKDEDAWTSQCDTAFELYNKLTEEGMAKEQARSLLPLGTYTEFLWTVNARSFMNWLDQRHRPAAQWEHREYARAALRLWRKRMPITAMACIRQYFLEGGLDECPD